MQVAAFTFNPFSENTYLLYDDTKECVIIDPGCSNEAEREELVNFIESGGLQAKMLINTHCHIDHILGNKFIADKYGLTLAAHKGEEPVLEAGRMTANMYAIPYEDSPKIGEFLEEGEVVKFGNTSLEILFTPGHSPASVSFYHKESKQLIAGDVLFQGSIGRTDLPGGDFDTLIRNIKEKFFVLDDDTLVYPGHGPKTTIGIEKKTNPFLQ